ncbi:MAG: imidazole glycerol phosphate synthase subunit HisH [Sphingopyxis sp.]
MESVALIDYGAGNLRSVANALRVAGADDVCVTADPEAVARANRIVLPGVGAFKHCIDALRAIDGLVEAMDARVRRDGAPFLGICVGMQLLAEAGEEHGVHVGLGWVGGTVREMKPADASVRIPHMGWNRVEPVRPHPLIAEGEAYFLHSYRFDAAEPGDVIAMSEHGGTFTAAVARGNVAGVQFHPEKSQAYGIALLRHFLAWRP